MSYDTNYKLPPFDIIQDEESKNIIDLIKKILLEEQPMIPIGFTSEGNFIEKINTMPNLLIGGTVMSGKSTYINSIVASILMTRKPMETKLIIFDSKGVDYSIYNGVPHLILPVINNVDKLDMALQRLCKVVEDRLSKIVNLGVKNANLYNNRVEEKDRLPDIIIVIDDLNSSNSLDSINKSIEYISTNGWNVNVHIILSINYPTAKIISTVSKENFPSRLSFKTTSSQTSQAIIGTNSAEKLCKVGEALYVSRFNSNPLKVSVPYLTDNDIEKIVTCCCSQLKASYDSLYLTPVNEHENDNLDDDYSYNDTLYEEVADFVISTGKVSASLLQRKYRFGYNRAARLVDLLEEKGIIGPQNNSKPREVLVSKDNKYKF